LHFLRVEEEPVAGFAHDAPILARVVVNEDCKVNAALEVLFDAIDDGGLSRQSQVEDIGAAAGAKPHAVALPDLVGPDVDAL
jgi:hypothetical protein